MDLHQRTLRVGLTAILCAFLFRVFSMGLPEKAIQWLTESNTASFLTNRETGRDVRFSASSEGFSPKFVETPPPLTPEPAEPAIPSFSDTDLIELYYAVQVQPDVEQLLAEPLEWDLRGNEPTVLILHTHSTESYTKTNEPYKETSQWRTLDEQYNMLSIGSCVASALEAQGIGVIQDRQLHDYPSYNGSYSHARSTIREYLEEYPSIRLVLDLHRDASEGENGQLRTLAQVDAEASAQLMVVLGTNHEKYEDNLSLGLKLHAQLETLHPGITRPLQLRGQRFNQDLLPGALLVEVGAAGNTHEEALTAARVLAEAVAALAKGTN